MSVFEKNKKDYVINGSLLNELRINNNLTLEDVALSTGLTINSIYCYEHNVMGINAINFYKLLLLLCPDIADKIKQFFKEVN